MKAKCDNCGEKLNVHSDPIECPFCESKYCRDCDGEIEEYPCDCGYDGSLLSVALKYKW